MIPGFFGSRVIENAAAGFDKSKDIHRLNEVGRLDALKRGITSTNSTERIPLLRDSNGNLIAPGEITPPPTNVPGGTPPGTLFSINELNYFSDFDYTEAPLIFLGVVSIYSNFSNSFNTVSTIELISGFIFLMYLILYGFVKK